MTVHFTRKTRRWPEYDLRRSNTQKGALTLLAAFLFFVFGTLGISMLFITQVYIKTGGFRRNKILLCHASENGIKQGLQDVMEKILSGSYPLVLSEGEYEALKGDIQATGQQVIGLIAGPGGHALSSGGGPKLTWEVETTFTPEKSEDPGDYSHIRYRGETISRGSMENFSQQSCSRLETGLDVFCGYLPAGVFPFLVSGEKDPQKKKDLLNMNTITIVPAKQNILPPAVLFTDESILSKRADSQLQKALKVEFFESSDLSVQQIREALGLEISDEPVPEGVYLIEDDLGLGGLYVQGGIERMTLSTEGSFQVVCFESEKGCWELKFSPSLSETVFRSPHDVARYDLVPRGIIIVDGRIASLSAEEGSSSENAAEDRPCILQGVNLTLISPDTITISSSLRYQGVDWKDQIPYLKDSSTQLNIIATGKDLFKDVEREGRIIVAESTPDDLCLHANLTACGDGFVAEDRGKSIQVFGGIQTISCRMTGTEVTVFPDQRCIDHQIHLRNSVFTAKPVLALLSWGLRGWKDG